MIDYSVTGEKKAARDSRAAVCRIGLALQIHTMIRPQPVTREPLKLKNRK